MRIVLGSVEQYAKVRKTTSEQLHSCDIPLLPRGSPPVLLRGLVPGYTAYFDRMRKQHVHVFSVQQFPTSDFALPTESLYLSHLFSNSTILDVHTRRERMQPPERCMSLAQYNSGVLYELTVGVIIWVFNAVQLDFRASSRPEFPPSTQDFVGNWD
jgi:hypothetical protein